LEAGSNWIYLEEDKLELADEQADDKKLVVDYNAEADCIDIS